MSWGDWGLEFTAAADELRFVHSPGDSRYCPKVEAFKPGIPWSVGSIAWQPHDGEVEYIETHRDHQRQGIGTALFNYAQGIDSRVHHSDTMSGDGAAFARSMGHDTSGATSKMSGANRTAGANGALPPLTMEPYKTAWSDGIMARHAGDGRPLGHLHWYPDGEIETVRVHDDFRRRGIADAMLKHAQNYPAHYPAEKTIHHSTQLTGSGRGWANADPAWNDPGDEHIQQADEDVRNWGHTAVKDYVPAHVPYTGQNEAEMSKHLSPEKQMPYSTKVPYVKKVPGRSASLTRSWPSWHGDDHPDVPFDKRWSPNHPEHLPGPWEA